jgi:hypothetical protein
VVIAATAPGAWVIAPLLAAGAAGADAADAVLAGRQ